MSDELRARRKALLDELSQVERALAGDAEPQTPVPSDGDWRALVAQAPEFLVLIDPDLRMRFVNHTQPGIEDVTGMLATDFIPEQHRSRMVEAVQRARATGRPEHYEIAGTGPHGEISSYSSWAVPLAGGYLGASVVLVTSDVSHQRRVEEALEDERSVLASLVDHAPDYIMVVDRAHKIRFMNRMPPGLTRDQVIGADAESFLAETQQDTAHAAIASVFATGRGVSYEAQVMGAEGPLWASTRMGPILRDGKVERVSLVARDVTEEKRLEAERARLNDELFQARKLQAVGQLTGGVAHDFNNLLTVIMAHTELLQARSAEHPRVLQHADQVLDAAKRAAALTQQLLAFARRQPLRPRVVDLRTVVGQMEQMLRRTLGETIEVRTEIPASLWSCEVDPAQLESALLNLAINARDAMPQGGVLTIALENVELPASRRDGTALGASGPHVALRVRDTGTGMEPDVLAKAYEPFFTTKDVGSGSGLGLSMVYGFVTQSGGVVDIRSELGRGTEIAIYLPRAGAGSLPEPEHASTPAPVVGDGQCILVVEDDPQVRALTVDQLTALGYRTLDAGNAADALEVLAATPDVSLILTDVVLPGGTSGSELARRVAESHPQLAVIFMSGYPADALAEDGRLEPTVTLLQKPFTHAQLARVVRAGVSGQRG